MAILPFGGFDPHDSEIDRDAAPEPLLKEIAQCAREGKAMRPNLAAWFDRMKEAEAIKVTVGKTRGAKAKDPETKKRWAMRKIRRLVRSGVDLNLAAAQVKTEVGLRASEPTIKGWIYEERNQWKADREHEEKWSAEVAISRFRELSRAGVPDQNALEQVIYEGVPLRPSDPAQYKKWQEEALYDPNDSSPLK